MQLFLDTSYLFPYIGLDLTENGKNKWTLNDLLQLANSSQDILYCDLSLFEIYAKSLKLAVKGLLGIPLEEVHSKLLVLSDSSLFSKKEFLPELVEQEILIELKKNHPDTIDCILFYLAVGLADAFLTMDEIFEKNIKKSSIIQDWMTETNPDFCIHTNDISFIQNL